MQYICIALATPLSRDGVRFLHPEMAKERTSTYLAIGCLLITILRAEFHSEVFAGGDILCTWLQNELFARWEALTFPGLQRSVLGYFRLPKSKKWSYQEVLAILAISHHSTLVSLSKTNNQ